MNDEKWVRLAEAIMLLALALAVSFVVDFTFSILSHLNKCP
jgi:hypothetical protein